MTPNKTSAEVEGSADFHTIATTTLEQNCSLFKVLLFSYSMELFIYIHLSIRTITRVSEKHNVKVSIVTPCHLVNAAHDTNLDTN